MQSVSNLDGVKVRDLAIAEVHYAERESELNV